MESIIKLTHEERVELLTCIDIQLEFMKKNNSESYYNKKSKILNSTRDKILNGDLL